MLLVRVGLGSSIADNVFCVLSFFLFPFVDFCAATNHVLLALSGFCFFFIHKLIQVVFPSLGGSSGFPLSSCRDDKSWFHSAALLVHLSSLCVAFRMA